MLPILSSTLEDERPFKQGNEKLCVGGEIANVGEYQLNQLVVVKEPPYLVQAKACVREGRYSEGPYGQGNRVLVIGLARDESD